MALHRDIYWVGRQWAVTGFGVQAVDQRLQGAFDIEVVSVWDDDLPERMRAHAWVNGDDFERALVVARRRFPMPPKPSPPPWPPLHLQMRGQLARFVPQWRVRR